MTQPPRKLTEQEIAPLAATVDAPESLHRRIEAMIAQDAPDAQASRRSGDSRAPRRLLGLGTLRTSTVAVATVAVAVVVALALMVGGTGKSPSATLNVRQAAALALSAATGPAPAENGSDRSQLRVSVGGVPFPYWQERFGWRGVGMRSDMVAGRSITTVFYANGAGKRVGYAIASGRAPTVRIGTIVHRWGVSYRVLSSDGATVVTWRRDGHLCVMAGRGVSAHTLLSLAGWDGGRTRTA